VVAAAAELRVAVDDCLLEPVGVLTAESVGLLTAAPVSLGVDDSPPAVVPGEASPVAVKLAASVGVGPVVAGPVASAAFAYLVQRPITPGFFSKALQMVG
jgi:hypothetical protein